MKLSCPCNIDESIIGICGEPGTHTCDICDASVCALHITHLEADQATHGIEVSFCDNCRRNEGYVGHQVPEKTISDECKYCSESEPEWSPDAKCWVHRRPTLDKRCTRKTMGPIS